eukprot:7442203-Ditylum_brightwellii.AAC.1
MESQAAPTHVHNKALTRQDDKGMQHALQVHPGDAGMERQALEKPSPNSSTGGSSTDDGIRKESS